MVLHDNDGFLNALVASLEKRKEKGSVTITFKRSNLEHRNGKNKTEDNYKCLVRVSDNKKHHSTVVTAKDQRKFDDSFATILKAHTSALKKRTRTEKARPSKRPQAS